VGHNVVKSQTMEPSDNKAVKSVDGPLAWTFEHALDPKRRLTIPAVWREAMGAPDYLLVMADPNDPCLTIVPPDVLKERMQRVRQQPLFDDGMTEALRDLFGHAENLAVDVQGRIRISDELLAFAGLEDNVVLCGAGVRIQLWSPKRRPVRRSIDQAAIANAANVLKF